MTVRQLSGEEAVDLFRNHDASFVAVWSSVGLLATMTLLLEIGFDPAVMLMG